MARNANEPSDDSSDRRTDAADEPKKKEKSRRPANTAFRQQRLKAWQPILTPKTVLPLFFIVGIIFAPIGGLLIWASSTVQEVSIDYSNCVRDAPDISSNPNDPNALSDIPSNLASSSFKTALVSGQASTWGRYNKTFQYPLTRGGRAIENTPMCVLEFYVPNDIGGPVFLYYRLTNFYQNHRRYVSSLDVDQLNGKFRDNGTIGGSDCDPLKADGNGTAYYPCGLIANSLFNDTINQPYKVDDNNNIYGMTENGIAWGSDADLYGDTAYKADQVVPPPNWQPRYENGRYNDSTLPNLHTDYAFQVWMRTAGLPAFSKLALRNDNEAMKLGRYRIEIASVFPVTTYGGTKSILLSTRTVMGGKNPFLGIAYVVVGGLCILLGAVFTATHLIKPRKLGDHTYLTWNNDQPSAATTTTVGERARAGA
ncbi:Lem3/Cdc50 [Pseudovirgaria hyperparasitica]|uniref:Lem3/Cdc50 n=1 Tax=Pseudovirgaria hyperparasitica TaxID=470096 RepID=A0A6A6W0R2_9PEZI|nr:Lem3/Cdc50 [Pseudovirgaria hyperparasitica]KAF2755520.1 Lem3/Cdc50 [Pseudovirgaria hyperparasitica]